MSETLFIHFQRGNKLLQLRRYQQAIEEYNKSIDADGRNGHIYLRLGFCYLELGNYTKATQFADKALGDNPQLSLAFYIKARISQRQKNFVHMRKHILNAIELDNAQAFYYAMLAETYIAENNLIKARELLYTGLALKPKDSECLVGVLKIEAKEENEGAFIVAAKEALAADPENDYTHEIVAWAYLRFKKYDKAKYHYRQALRINPAREGLEERLGTVDVVMSVNGDRAYTKEDYIFTALAFITLVAFARIALDLLFYFTGHEIK